MAISCHQEDKSTLHPAHSFHTPFHTACISLEQSRTGRTNPISALIHFHPSVLFIFLYFPLSAIFLFELLLALYTLTEESHTVHEHLHPQYLWKPSFKSIFQGGEQIVLMHMGNSLLVLQELPL